MGPETFLSKTLRELLAIPSPTGMTGASAAYVCGKLDEWGVEYTVNRRGTITARMPGKSGKNAKAFIAHLDTLGLIVSRLKDNGCVAVREIGYLTARMIEGVRVTIHTRKGPVRGTLLPLKTSVHVHDHEPIHNQGFDWENLQIRVDEAVFSKKELVEVGVEVGDIISLDTNAEVTSSGFVVSRFLDNMGGASCLLATLHDILSGGLKLPHDTYFVFSVNEETEGSGARFLPENVTEAIAVDCAPVDETQASSEYACTIGVKEYEVVYDRPLVDRLVAICQKNGINYRLDVFYNFSTDVHNILTSGRDVQVGFLGFGTDSTHAYERTHISALAALKQLVLHYAQAKAEVVALRQRPAKAA